MELLSLFKEKRIYEEVRPDIPFFPKIARVEKHAFEPK